TVLAFASGGMLLLAVASAILLAADHPGWTLAITAPMLPAAAIGHVLVIPRAGAFGAALVTAGTAFAAATVACVCVRRLVHVPMPYATIARAAIVSALA